MLLSKKLLRALVSAFLSVAVIFGATAMAESSGCNDPVSACQAIGSWDLSLSIGVGARSNPLVDGDEQLILLVPQFSWYGEKLFLDNFDLGYTFIDQPRHMLNALVGISFDHIYFDEIGLGNITLNTGGGLNGGGALNGANTDRDPEFTEGLNPSQEDSEAIVDIDDLSQRKIALLGGLDYSYFSDALQFNLQALSDVSGVHNGQEFRLSTAYLIQNPTSLTTLALGMAWQSEALLDYYYGLDAGEISTGSPAYEMESGITTFAKITYEKRLSKKWSLLSTLQYRKLPSSLETSPIVEKTGVVTFFVGGSYHF